MKNLSSYHEISEFGNWIKNACLADLQNAPVDFLKDSEVVKFDKNLFGKNMILHNKLKVLEATISQRQT
jgi:hypothetical protein